MNHFIPSLIIWLCLLGVIYCIYRISQELHLIYIQNHKLSEFELPPFLIRYIRIDGAFSTKEKIAIVEALQEWERKTSGLLAFDIVNLEASEIYNENGGMPEETKEYERHQVMTFIRALKTSKSTKMMEEEHGKRAYGYAVWGKFLYIGMVSDRIPNRETFKATAMHEVGHLLGMNHLECKNSLMYKYTNKNINTLTKKDLAYFLKCYDYEVSNKPQDILQRLRLQEQAKSTCL